MSDNEIKKGTRIRLIQMRDEKYPVKPGTTGTVSHIDDIGTIHMIWDNGRSLGLIPGIDSFEIITEGSET